MDTWALSLLSSSFKRSMCSIFSFNSSEQLASLALYEGHLGQSLACADVILLVSCVTGLDGSVPFSAAGTFNYATQLSYVSILSPHALNLREKKERREKRERLFNGSTPHPIPPRPLHSQPVSSRPFHTSLAGTCSKATSSPHKVYYEVLIQERRAWVNSLDSSLWSG